MYRQFLISAVPITLSQIWTYSASRTCKGSTPIHLPDLHLRYWPTSFTLSSACFHSWIGPFFFSLPSGGTVQVLALTASHRHAQAQIMLSFTARPSPRLYNIPAYEVKHGSHPLLLRAPVPRAYLKMVRFDRGKRVFWFVTVGRVIMGWEVRQKARVPSMMLEAGNRLKLLSIWYWRKLQYKTNGRDDLCDPFCV